MNRRQQIREASCDHVSPRIRRAVFVDSEALRSVETQRPPFRAPCAPRKSMPCSLRTRSWAAACNLEPRIFDCARRSSLAPCASSRTWPSDPISISSERTQGARMASRVNLDRQEAACVTQAQATRRVGGLRDPWCLRSHIAACTSLVQARRQREGRAKLQAPNLGPEVTPGWIQFCIITAKIARASTPNEPASKLYASRRIDVTSPVGRHLNSSTAQVPVQDKRTPPSCNQGRGLRRGINYQHVPHVTRLSLP